MGERIEALDKTTNNNEYADLVVCNNCGRIMLVDLGTEKCPECDENGVLSSYDDNKPEFNRNDANLLLFDTE